MPESRTRQKPRGKKRPVAGRKEIISTARDLGVRDGWKAVTIRAVARELGYTSPLLYEYFRDKGELLTQVAVEGMVALEAKLSETLPAQSQAFVSRMIEGYWTFMIENTQLYRLMNGMDGVPIDKDALNGSAQSMCKLIATALRPMAGKKSTEADALALTYQLWALLHGMSTLYMDRSVRFTQEHVSRAARRLLSGDG